MIVECNKKTVNLKSVGVKNKNTIWVEQDILVPDSKPDVMKVIMVNATPYILNKEIQNDKVKIDGKINYFIIYKTSNDILNTRGLYMSYPFTANIPIKDINKDMNLYMKIDIGNIIYSLPNERKIQVKSEVICSYEYSNNMKLDIIENFYDKYNIQTKKKTCKCMNYLLEKNSIIASREEVLLANDNQNFYEILNIHSRIQNTDYKESYNKIMVKGDIALDILYLSEENNSTINKMPLEIPFSGMIELDNINDKSKFDIDYNIKDLSIRCNLENITSKMMEVDYQIEVCVKMYEEEEISYVEDFYSQTNEIKADFKKISPLASKVLSSKSLDIKENVNNVLDNNYKILDYSILLNNLHSKENNGVIVIDGNVKVDMLLQNIDTGEIENKNFEVLINESISNEKINNNNSIDIELCVEKTNILLSGRDIEIKMRINIKIAEDSKLDINYTEQLEMLDECTDNLNSMYIYMVKSNDTLWSIAKKYKTTENNIMQINSLSDINTINENQKLLIIR